VESLSILVFSDNPAVEETHLVIKELKKRGICTELLSPWDIHFPKFLTRNFDLVYVPSNMLHRGSSFEFIHRLLILRRFEESSRVVNSVPSMVNYSKEHLTVQLNKHRVNHPKTLITENLERAKEFAVDNLQSGKEVIIKPICKARGVGVSRLSKVWENNELNQYLLWYARKQGQGVFYLQEHIPNYGFDIRCLVVGGQVVGREKRSNPTDFRYNVAVGGNAEPYDCSRYDELAVSVAGIVGLDITGLDILPGIDKVDYVLEANAYPGYKALMETTGINIPEKIVDYLLSLL
jgi:RimK family alpha-L-glutamate ligase